MQWPSFSLVISQIFLVYIVYSIYSLSLLFVAPSCESGKPCLSSCLSEKPQLQLHVYSSTRKLSLATERDVELLHVDKDFDYSERSELPLSMHIPQRTREYGILYLLVILTPASKASKSFRDLENDPKMVHTIIKMTQHVVPEAEAFSLLSDKETETKVQKKIILEPVPHLKSKVTFNVMTDDIKFPVDNLPFELVNHLRIIHGRILLPIISHDFLQSRQRDLVQITPQNTTVNFTLSYEPITIGKLRLILHVKTAMQSLKNFGFSDKDVDEVKGIFADTNIYLLGGTFFIAAVHMLFDFLAFKNDVSFWRKKNSLVGLSKWTVIWRCFSQAVIFLYLLDEGSSLLILIPAGIGSIIEMWKLKKVLRLRLKESNNCVAEMKTREFDSESMKYLSYLLYPLVLGGAIYSLLYQPHKSWYSWTMNSLVNGVYAFGFLFMLPQLFVNYKLKSVAHLPWRTFMYKAFNTFIDDIFAFIITMPTAHRIACFRDDAVFLIYLYQRWLYPVDKSRVDLDTATDQSVDFGHADKKQD